VVGSEGMGTLNITNGGTMMSHSLNAGDFSGSTGHIVFSGAGSNGTVVTTLVGSQGTGSLIVSGGAQFVSDRLWVGFKGNGDGTVDVQSPGSTLNITGSGFSEPLKIGGESTLDGGIETMTVSAGGTLISHNDTYIGGNLSSVGSLTVTGLTSLADSNDGGTDDVLVVGYAGEGTLSILNGGRVESEISMIGQIAGATGTANVGDGNAQANWNVGGSLYVGGSDTQVGGTGLLNINSQGTVTVVDELKIWDDSEVLLNSPTATLSVGALTSVEVGARLTLAGGSLTADVLTNEGLFDFNSGTLTITGTEGVIIGPSGPLTALTLSSGRTLDVAHVTTVATGGALTVTEGAFSSNILKIDGGTVDAPNLSGVPELQVDAGILSLSGNLTPVRVSGNTPGAINASGNIFLGDGSRFDGYDHQGTLSVGSHQVTLQSASFANLGTLTTLDGGVINATKGVTLGVGDTLTGTGEVNAKIVQAAGSIIVATGDLTLGNSSSFAGFISDGEIRTGIHTVTIHDANKAVLGAVTEVGTSETDGVLDVPNGIQLNSGKAISGRGAVNASVEQASGSVIVTTGNLTLGDATSFAGFSSSGELQVNSHTVTLNDRDKAILGSLTEIGSGGISGTLTASNGALLEEGKVLVGQGTVNTENDEFRTLGLVQGDGAGITFNDEVTGNGNFGGTVTFNGGYTPGGTPTLIELEDVTFGIANTLTINIGGVDKGTQYVALDISGTANLGGTLSASLVNLGSGTFVPTAGDSFEIITAAGGINGTFDGALHCRC
jgi:T5SS/PEP-CTERM-associated repeat protein